MALDRREHGVEFGEIPGVGSSERNAGRYNLHARMPRVQRAQRGRGVRGEGEELIAPGGQLKGGGHGELQTPVHARLLINLIAHLDVDGIRLLGENGGK